ncbi:MAG: endopeptidase La [Anaerolineales bacterium]|nr:endopeptidase La [Anaerolineales bacterium]
MTQRWLDWPHLPSEWSSAISRRADELYGVEEALIDEEGLIECAVLPLRDVVLFPNMVTPLFVAHDSSLLAIEDATRSKCTMVAVAQLDEQREDPTPGDLYAVGTEIAVGKFMHLPDGSSSVLAQGRRRVQIVEYIQIEPFMRVRARPIEEATVQSKETLALMRAVLTLFEKCVQLNRALPEEAYVYAVNIEEPGWLADLVVSALNISIPERQAILETFEIEQRLQRTSVLLGRELDVLELEDQIHSRVQSEVDRSQREIYLREQIKAIQTELGESDIWTQEITELRQRIQHLSLPEEVETTCFREIQRLSQMPPMSPEVGIIRTYVDWLMGLPWQQSTTDNSNIQHVARTLDDQHHGLDKAKERILEYIAVKSLAPPKQRQPILCFVGPPGTGKTSLGRSIAEALGRKFVRISLGGIRDEAEIRGHRRTYIGALPGRILQTMRKAETVNPLFMLDEIDKLGQDFRGDPAAALLEVLDPEQNHAFSDHYMEIPYDLSKVLFITTANTVQPIPPALLDRLEVIEFPGYIEEEKLIIARKFLVPRQLEQNGLHLEEIKISDEAIRTMIREYTWEAGVRNLEREIGKVCRKIARRKAEGKTIPRRITKSMLARDLGPPQITPHEAEMEDQLGAVTGLVWTENGGDTLSVEALLYDGKGNLQITGQVGEIMQESGQAALSYIKSRAKTLKISMNTFEKNDIHIHVPEGAIPKDGPSAGITIATAMASILTGRHVRRDVGMSGEITLRGRVLPIGGVRDKVLAAYRLKLKTVVIPEKNKKDLVEIPRQAKSALDIRLVKHMDEVLDLALLPAQTKQEGTSVTKRRTSNKRTTSKTSQGK